MKKRIIHNKYKGGIKIPRKRIITDRYLGKGGDPNLYI